MKSGWQIKKLGDLLELQNGYAFDSKRFNTTDGIPLIRIRSLKAGLEKETRYRGDYDNKYVVKAGDLLIGMDGEFGCYEWKGEPALLNQRVCRLQRFSEKLMPRFLFYGVNDHLKAIEDVTGYTTVKHISSRQILEIEFPVPSLEEQKRIVAKLDEAFAGLAKAKENAEKNLQNARALFESHLESVFNQRGPGWAEKPLGKVCDLQNGYAFKSGDYINASNTLNIRMSNIRPGGSFDPEHNQRFLPDSYARKYAAFLLREGDLIIAMTDMAGDPKILGVPTLVGNLDGRNFLMNQRVGKLFGFSADVRPPYLRYFLTSPLVKQFYKSKGAGGLQINISKGDILSVKIPLPDVTNQDLVVKQLDALTEETQRLARLYEQKLEALESFKKSILHEAFNGNL